MHKDKTSKYMIKILEIFKKKKSNPIACLLCGFLSGGLEDFVRPMAASLTVCSK